LFNFGFSKLLIFWLETIEQHALKMDCHSAADHLGQT
jgi:hypothetical protein